MKLNSPDPLGSAICDFFVSRNDKQITILSSDFEEDSVTASYFFRDYQLMPSLEQEALKRCKGKILDIGACAGSHALWLQNKGLNVTALELSHLCCQTMQKRGIRQIVESDIFHYSEKKFDTLLLLMNGTGIAGTLNNLSKLLLHLKNLLTDNGQILIDSSDLIYLHEDENGEAVIDLNSEKYYGEIHFQFEYNGVKSKSFPWLYTDIETLEKTATDCGLKIKQIIKGDHYDFLAQIEKINE